MSEKQQNKEAYVVTEQVGHLLRKAYQRHLAIFQENAIDPNLTSVQFVALCALREHGPSSQAELVKATAIDQATIRGIIDRLKARKLISLGRDDKDGRKVIMSLRAEGEALVQEMYASARLISELTVKNLNPAERIAFDYLLRKVIDE